MAKQYIPGVSGLLTEPNPADSPSNTLSEAENVIIEQRDKIQARHGFNVKEFENTITTSLNTPYVNDFIYTSQYSNVLPFIKFLEYKDSDDQFKTLFFVKQNINAYAPISSGIYATNNIETKNRYYIVDQQGNLNKYETLNYANVDNVFNTKESIYLQTENGIAEAYVNDIELDDTNKFFNINWPAFPKLSYRLKTSNIVANWLRGGHKCNIKITFYRELGYSDKENEIYESEPSPALLVVSPLQNSIPELYIDFNSTYEANQFYKQYNEFTKCNSGRKFGIKVYRTKIVPIDSEMPTEYFQCYSDIEFDKFFTSTIFDIDKQLINGNNLVPLRDGSDDFPLELQVNDTVSVINDLTGSTFYRVFSGDSSLYIDAPTQFVTTDADLLKIDYRPTRLVVTDKQLFNNKYYYRFQTVDYVYNSRINTTSAVLIPFEYINDYNILNTNFDSITAANNNFTIIRSYKLSLDINDNGLITLPQLYTNINIDGQQNTNIIVPRASDSCAYKDFRVYYQIQKSLTASLNVITQPIVEQCNFTHVLSDLTNTGQPANTFVSTTKKTFYIPSQTLTVPTVTNNVTATGSRLFLDSAIFPNQDTEIKQLNVSTNTLVTEKQSVDTNIINVSGTSLTQTMLNQYYMNATIYEQSKLTLKLTSLEDVVDTVSIKTIPLYNRRGYYNKYNTAGELDNRSLETDVSLNESNLFQVKQYPYLVRRQVGDILSPVPSTPAGASTYMVPHGFGIFHKSGSLSGQLQNSAALYGVAYFETETGRSLFFDLSKGRLVIRRDATYGVLASQFDPNKFTSPGYLMIQWTDENSSKNHAIYSYQNITQLSFNQYEISGVNNIVGFLLVSNAVAATALVDIYFLDTSSIDNLPIYPYSPAPNIRKVNVNISTSYATVNEYYSGATDRGSPADPYFTYIPHQNKSSKPIAVVSAQNGNHRFIGVSAGYGKSQDELLDDYAWSIINQFNKELRYKNINATLRKGSGIGEIIIDYPNGKKIEIQNNFGSHSFLPKLSTSTYTTLAERVTNEYLENNLIQWSRRKIPEITTPELFMFLGKNDKKIIGAAANTDDLYIFKEDGIWRCTDSGDSSPSANLPIVSNFVFSNNLICQSKYSIQTINDEIIFLSQYGFISITNSGIQNISGAIQRDILTLLQISPKSRIRSFVNEFKNLYYCTLINESDDSLGVKSGTYIFNVKTREWTFMDEEILDGISDSNGKNLVAYRQRPVNAKLLNRKSTTDGIKPLFYFTQSYDTNNRLIRPKEVTPLDMFYVTREQFTNNIKSNSVDQYDFISETRTEGPSATFWIQKSDTNEFYIKTETIPLNSFFRNRFSSSIEYALMSSSTSVPNLNETVPVIDSFVTLFANRTLYLKRNNTTAELIQIRLKKTDIQNLNVLVYFEFVDTPPTWFSTMSVGYFNTNLIATYQILAGVPTKIVFNPESGGQPDTNKLFQEYMIHTETSNKGALMSFKTDSQSSFSNDRRFIYDANSNNRNIFRTYIPTNVSRGRYLIRQVKHDVPLENLIITGQTIVMRDSGSTRVQKDRDDA
jgi:hypothetical protein